MRLLLFNSFDLCPVISGISTTWAFRMFQPGIEPTTTHSQSPTHQINWKCSSVIPYENVLHCGSFEKMATAFFNISRSIRRRLFSRLSWRNSSSSRLKRPLPGNGSTFGKVALSVEIEQFPYATLIIFSLKFKCFIASLSSLRWRYPRTVLNFGPISCRAVPTHRCL